MQHPASNKLTVLALLLLGIVVLVCASLGRWQLSRADERRAISAEIERGRLAAPLLIRPDMTIESVQPWRAASASGHWAAQFSVMVDNRNLDGRPGLWLATPLILEGGVAVLVLRGWIPRPIGTEQAPKIATQLSMHTVEGEMSLRVPRLFELWTSKKGEDSGLPSTWKGIAAVESGWVDTSSLVRVQNLDLGSLAERTGLKFLPVVLLQNSPAQEGLSRNWPKPSLDADKNVGYATQWFGFAAIAAIAFCAVLWRFVRRRRRQIE
jgi:surfeit locus 1 family protein